MTPQSPRCLFSLAGRRVFVAGHRGMVGAAVVRRLRAERCLVLTAARSAPDLECRNAVDAWFAAQRPEVVILAAARVGGIGANLRDPVSFLTRNLAIQTNVLRAAQAVGVAKLLFLGSSCLYPRDAPPPIAEEALMTGPLEPTNAAYATAKIAGIELCRAYRRQYGADFIVAMPTNLYGPGDRYDAEDSHVVAALIRKMHRAKVSGDDAVTIWGSGRPRREVLFVEDAADACVHLLQHYSGEVPVNVGVGRDLTIDDLAARIAAVVGFDGRFVHDTSRPDGVPQKRLDVSRLTALDWRPRTSLDEGLARTYRAYLAAGAP